MKRALLLSGGMDSSSIAYWRPPDLAITIDYGQRSAEGELRASTAIASALGIRQEIIRCDLSALGSGDLAGTEPLADAPASEWWPYRNQMLVTLAAMLCARHGVECLEVGALRTDGFHADGRPDYDTPRSGITAAGTRLYRALTDAYGPCGARDEFLLAATAQNLRRLAKLRLMRPPQGAIAA